MDTWVSRQSVDEVDGLMDGRMDLLLRTDYTYKLLEKQTTSTMDTCVHGRMDVDVSMTG